MSKKKLKKRIKKLKKLIKQLEARLRLFIAPNEHEVDFDLSK